MECAFALSRRDRVQSTGDPGRRIFPMTALPPTFDDTNGLLLADLRQTILCDS